ncbi:hypothetical protein D3C87_1544590 [compost metagenome]
MRDMIVRRLGDIIRSVKGSEQYAPKHQSLGIYVGDVADDYVAVHNADVEALVSEALQVRATIDRSL